jgi:hypothetical protein
MESPRNRLVSWNRCTSRLQSRPADVCGMAGAFRHRQIAFRAYWANVFGWRQSTASALASIPTPIGWERSSCGKRQKMHRKSAGWPLPFADIRFRDPRHHQKLARCLAGLADLQIFSRFGPIRIGQHAGTYARRRRSVFARGGADRPELSHLGRRAPCGACT